MRKLISDLMLEAANHRFQDTTDRICLTSFSEKWIWNEGIALDLFHVDSMPRLHLFRWFVNPPLDALKNRWNLTSFIGCNTVFIALLDDGVNYLDLTQEITKNPPINRHFRLLHAFTWHLSMIKMIHRDLLSSRPMFTTTICGSMTLSWWGVLSHGCGRGMLITL